MNKAKSDPWNKPNSYGELAGGICCMRSTSGVCYEHDKRNYKHMPKASAKSKKGKKNE